MDFTEILSLVQLHHDLSEQQMKEAIGHILSGQAELRQIVQFLSIMHEKGETAEELAGAAKALRDSMIPLNCSQRPVLDTCGTGGDGSKTFNISTAAALVLAATGHKVAKHGNRAITSRTGSADVLAELGVNLEAPPEVAARCIEKIGICFCFAPYFHPTMRHAGPARREIPHPTIFNRLGPLANPAGSECQILGVGQTGLQYNMAHVLQRLGTSRSLVVRGDDGVDEISVSAPTLVLEVTASEIVEHRWSPESFGIEPADRRHLYADDPATSAECIREILSGRKGPCRDVVVINAAAALWLVSPTISLEQCARQIEAAIDDGKANEILQKLSHMTQ